MPASFRFMDQQPVLLLPLQLDRNKTFLGNFNYRGIARLKPGGDAGPSNRGRDEDDSHRVSEIPSLPRVQRQNVRDARLGPKLRFLKQDLVGDIGNTLWILMGTIGTVLLIACANVANLVLVRVDGRQHELAIRAALGAGWGRIAGELLAESVAIGLLGGAIGLTLAYGAVRLLLAIAPANLPRLNEISIDPWVMLFTLAISLLAGLVFGLVPVVKYVGPRVVLAARCGQAGAT